MGKDATYTVEIGSGFAEFWRYNIAVTCGMFGADDVQCGFVSAEDKVAPVGSNLSEAPKGTPSRRSVRFEAGDCHHLRMYVYLIPHSLPKAVKIADCKPFTLSIKVSYGDETVLHEKRSINQWSGASIEIIASRPQNGDSPLP